MLVELALVISFGVADADLTPNYAKTLLPPMEKSDQTPRLFAAIKRLPIRIGVLPDPILVTPYRLSLIKAACQRWATALRLSKKGSLSFEFAATRGPGDVDIAFRFTTMEPGLTLRGYTTMEQGFTGIQLAVKDANGKAIPHEEIIRVAAHELGHAFGIWGHSPDDRDIMSLSLKSDKVTTADVNTLLVAYKPEKP